MDGWESRGQEQGSGEVTEKARKDWGLGRGRGKQEKREENNRGDREREEDEETTRHRVKRKEGNERMEKKK